MIPASPNSEALALPIPVNGIMPPDSEEARFTAEQMRAAISADRSARAVPDWREHADVLVDIYFDGVNNAPDDRCYVDGALGAAMERTRISLAAAPVTSQAESVPSMVPMGEQA